jgi:molecular chaperone GrpE
MAQQHGPSTAEVAAQEAPAEQAPPRPSESAGEVTGAAAAAPDSAARIAELEAALAAAKAEAAAHWDKYLRERAEMENYKKRLERTYADLAKRGRKELLLKLLGVGDNLERAIAYESGSGQEVDSRNLATGLRMTYLQFKELLGGEGVREVKTVGEQFDPAVHEAVAAEVTADRPEGEVVAEVQKGYLYQDELLRPARVKVAAKEE